MEDNIDIIELLNVHAEGLAFQKPTIRELYQKRFASLTPYHITLSRILL